MSALSDLLRRATARTSGPWGDLAEPRVGVMLHYTAGTDYSGVQWLLFDPACKVSYNWLVLDDGTVVNVAPNNKRAYHAGACRPSANVPPYTGANSAWYGVAIAAEAGDTATAQQVDVVVQVCAGLFRKHGWPASEVPRRITDHAAEAWPRGRKVDTGAVLPVAVIRRKVASLLSRQVAA